MNNQNFEFLLKENQFLLNKLIYNPLKKYQNILLVGFTGLIGINILASLINIKKKFNINNNITCINSSPISFSLKKYIKKNKIKYLKKNVINNFRLSSQFDLIIFCAGYASPSKFMKNVKDTILLNSLGLVNTAKFLKQNGKLVFFSSSEIYNGLENNFLETNSGKTNFDDARSSYINGKKFGETYCNILEKLGYSILILRLCLAYGPGTPSNDQRVLNEFIVSSLKYNKIKMLDNGSAMRNYIYINDALFYFFKLLVKSKYNIYNITGNSLISIKNLALKISSIVNCKVIYPKKKFGILGAVKYVNISPKRLKAEYKLKLTTLDHGLKKTIDWYKKLFLKNL